MEILDCPAARIPSLGVTGKVRWKGKPIESVLAQLQELPEGIARASIPDFLLGLTPLALDKAVELFDPQLRVWIVGTRACPHAGGPACSISRDHISSKSLLVQLGAARYPITVVSPRGGTT
jgi:hypothetical protein